MESKDVILVVDDQPMNLKVIASVLGLDYSLSIANNGTNALKMLENGLPDLILLDIMMPDMDGYEVCRRIKANEKTKDIPIIFLTAKTDIDDIIKGFDLGAVDYITKPFNPTEMRVRVVNHLNLYHARNEIKQMYHELLLSKDELRKTNRQLEQSNKEKDKFFSIISHDLRSPLSGFLGLTQLMADDIGTLPPDEVQVMASAMKDSAVNLYRLLENLLEWASMEQRLIPFNPEIVRVNTLVDDSVSMLMETARFKGINISYTIPDDVMAYADSNMLKTILRNLVSNAVKFTPAGGKVRVSAKMVDANYTEISVADSGIGMNADIINNLFRIDARTGREGTAGEASAGLGLILCKDFIEKHRGKIWAESEVGKGSSFCFTLASANS